MAPYFISDQTDCPDWAVVKEDGSVVACQDSKQSAIDQMVALSLAEELEPGGELRALPDNYRPALSDDVPEGRACGNCFFYNDDRVNPEGDKAWCERWDEFVDGGSYCNAWEPDDNGDDLDDDMDDREPIGRMQALANSLIARINTEETMTKENKWLDVARAIALKIDGPQPESKEPEVRVNTLTSRLGLRAMA
jgi:hypothetical protein